MVGNTTAKVKDLIGRIGTIDQALVEWGRALDVEAERLARERGVGPEARLKYLAGLAGEDGARIRATVGVGPRDAAYDFLDELCAAYLEAKSGEHEGIRQALAGTKRLRHQLFDYAGRCVTFIHSPEDIQWLRLGLAAASIEDVRIDFRDTLLALGSLYTAAVRAGIEPLTQFNAVAEISNSERSTAYNHRSMREFLAGFQSTAFFEADVKPRLTRGESA